MEPIEAITSKELCKYEKLKKIKPVFREWNVRILNYKDNTIPIILYIYKYKLQDKMNFSAVYFLVDNKEVVYVGQAINLYRRIMEHKDKIFDDVYYFETDNTELNVVEEYFIIAMNPKYNKTLKVKIKTNERMIWLEERRKLTK